MELGKNFFLIQADTASSLTTTIWPGVRKDESKPEKHAIKEVKKSE